MKEVSWLLSMNQLVTTPYHPVCNGLVERFNGTLKTMLKRMCAEKFKDWVDICQHCYLHTEKFCRRVWGAPRFSYSMDEQ